MRIVNSTGRVFGELDSLPGCSQVVVSHAVFKTGILPGEGKAAHAERLAQMRALGWDYALCTVNIENKAQLAIMKRFQWKRLDGFTSDKTGNAIDLYGKQLWHEDYLISRASTLLENK